jgi:hypothetical protein
MTNSRDNQQRQDILKSAFDRWPGTLGSDAAPYAVALIYLLAEEYHLLDSEKFGIASANIYEAIAEKTDDTATSTFTLADLVELIDSEHFNIEVDQIVVTENFAKLMLPTLHEDRDTLAGKRVTILPEMEETNVVNKLWTSQEAAVLLFLHKEERTFNIFVFPHRGEQKLPFKLRLDDFIQRNKQNGLSLEGYITLNTTDDDPADPSIDN